ncbi:hypothetical protein [Streptomyces iconiensis]|uniref:Histidine kinase-, DNA gyrase B-, and HSP90-like ATPase n=1 Tax=Streptomyces iconiensis TaxID=1384038 RepID=A0ABT7A7N3_9ACTN|nr:hypothetical protein [Streptomyces iconiensis]MDJ1137340.1 hypothetical protein [Streptomyces iconiensis]
MTGTTTQARWYSQPFPPEGAGAAEGIRNQLGRPELDLLTILVREAAQNSWDARDTEQEGSVEFGIELRTVGPAHATSWRELLTHNAPRTDRLPLRGSLGSPSIRLMVISDRGTCGLGGPTRADDGVPGGQDFVAFVRNVGEPRDGALGGGTYGFGKSIFYLLSKAGTVLVHTRCRTPAGELETRLMGCALWTSFHATTTDGSTRRFTGRHWWGDASGDVIEPLTGRTAEDTAKRLGLTPFGPGETGTSVVVVDPHLDALDAQAAAAYLAQTMAWQLWPKMLERADGRVPMRFSVTCDGLDVPVPDPRSTRPLNLFVDAFRKMEGGDGQELMCRRPHRLLGRLGLVKRLVPSPSLSPAARRAMESAQIGHTVHHVCLMRPAELVVTYYAGREPGMEQVSYAGVFRADTELDEVFAQSEPPTHDAWNPQSLELPDSSFVRTTFTRIKESVEGLLELGGSARGGSAHVALGAASTRFSSLVGGAWGIGAGTDYGTAVGRAVAMPDDDTEDAPAEGAAVGGTSDRHGAGTPRSLGEAGGLPAPRPSNVAKHRPRVQYVGDTSFEERSGVAVLVQHFRLPAPVAQRVRVELAVALPGAGNRETDPPMGAPEPQLVGWEDPSGDLHTTPTYVIEGGDDAVWRAVVLPAPDTITEITVKTRAVSLT